MVPEPRGHGARAPSHSAPRPGPAMRVVVAGHVRGSPGQSHPAHDAALWNTLLQCLGGPTPNSLAYARAVACLPAAMGGLGLSLAARVSLATCWAGWADVLAVIQARCAGFAEARVAKLSSPARARPAQLTGNVRRPELSWLGDCPLLAGRFYRATAIACC